MTEKFLRAPRWQLLACSFGLPFLAQLTGVALSIYYLNADPTAAAQPVWPRYLSSAGSLAIAGVLYGWMWSVGAGLQSSLPREFRRSVIGFGVVLLVLVSVCLASLFFPGNILLFQDETNTFTLLFWTLLPLLAVWMGAHLYGASYVADIIISAEEERPPSGHELIRLTLLIWLFPVGIWTVQPRVNQLAGRISPVPATGFQGGAAEKQRMAPRVAIERPMLQD